MTDLHHLFNKELAQEANSELIEFVDCFDQLMDMEDHELIDKDDILQLENYAFEQVDSDIRSGDGAYIEMTFKATKKSSGQFVYLKYFGEYSSWDSHYWYKTPKVVYPRQRTITEYVELKKLEK